MSPSLLLMRYLEKRCAVKKGTRPIILVNGSHQKTIIFGALTHDGRQLFRQYKKFDQYCFFGLSKGIAQKVWQDSSLCRLSTTTQIKTSTKIS